MADISRRQFIKIAGSTVLAAGALASFGTMAGCSSSSKGADTSKYDNTIKTETEDLNLVLLGKDAKIACIIVAIKSGFYEEEGLNVQTQTVSGGFPEAMPALSNGSADVLPFGSIPTCTYVSQGDDLVIFGGTVTDGSECVTLIENKDNYKKAEDFKGKRIGCFRMETGHMVMKSWLRKQGLKVGPLDEGNDVEFILLEGSAAEVAAVEKGEIDMCFVNSGYGVNAVKTGKCAIAFRPNELIGKEFPCCRQSTNRNAFENKRSALIKFEIANLRAQQVVANDHETTLKMIQEYSGQDADYVEKITYGKDGYVAAMKFEMDPNTDAVTDFYADMIDNGDIENTDKELIKKHLDSSIYKVALDTLIKRGENKDYYNQLLEKYNKQNTLGL